MSNKIAFIIDTLETAIGWADYADEYFKKKHGLDRDREDVNKSIELIKELQATIEAQEIIIKDKSMYMEAMAQPKTCENCKYYIEQDLYSGSCITLEYDVSSKWGCLSYELKAQHE